MVSKPWWQVMVSIMAGSECWRYSFILLNGDSVEDSPWRWHANSEQYTMMYFMQMKCENLSHYSVPCYCSHLNSVKKYQLSTSPCTSSCLKAALFHFFVIPFMSVFFLPDIMIGIDWLSYPLVLKCTAHAVLETSKGLRYWCNINIKCQMLYDANYFPF